MQEAEKLGVLEDLAAQIQNDDPSVVYDAYLVEGNDVGGIDVGFLVRSSAVQVNAVTQLAADELLTFDGSLLHDRPPLLLEADFLVSGYPVFPIEVMVVHNRSLNNIDDPNSGERVRVKRLEQAQSIAQIVQDRQMANPDVRLTIVGDFNAFEFTDGYVDAVGQIRGVFNPDDNLVSGDDLVDPDLTNQVLNLPADERYSFIFRGTAQVLDHALTTVGLDPFVNDFSYGRGNAGAPLVYLDDDTTPLRASDHDGFVLYVDIKLPFVATAVFAAENSMYLQTNTTVESGDLLVRNDAAGETLAPGYELVLSKLVTTPAGYDVKADGLLVMKNAEIGGDAYYNSLDNLGAIQGAEISPLDLPVFDFPAFLTSTPGTDPVFVPKNGGATLDAGVYGDVIVRQGGTLHLTGGQYDIASLTVLKNAEVRFENTIDMRIAGRVDVGLNATLAPADLSSMAADDFVMYVAGSNGEGGGLSDTPYAVSVAKVVHIQANVFAPNGSIVMDDNVHAEGAFLARDIMMGKNGTVLLDSYWQETPAVVAQSGRADDLILPVLEAELPDAYALSQNYPNPFNPTTAIPFSLPESGHVKLAVYDMLGRLVDTLIDGEMNAGFHQATFNARSYPSGAYIYRLEVNNFVEVKKMMLVK